MTKETAIAIAIRAMENEYTRISISIPKADTPRQAAQLTQRANEVQQAIRLFQTGGAR